MRRGCCGIRTTSRCCSARRWRASPPRRCFQGARGRRPSACWPGAGGRSSPCSSSPARCAARWGGSG